MKQLKKRAVEMFGSEFVEKIYDIKKDKEQINLIAVLANNLAIEKVEEDTQKFIDNFLSKEEILISIDGSKLLNRFIEYNVIFNSENDELKLMAEIMKRGETISFDFIINNVIKNGSQWTCRADDGNEYYIKIFDAIVIE